MEGKRVKGREGRAKSAKRRKQEEKEKIEGYELQARGVLSGRKETRRERGQGAAWDGTGG
jgi:hypothetical protein